MLKKLFKKTKEETGNTILMFLIMTPMILGMFGIAADAIIYVNVRTGVQDALDSASVVYASQIHDPRYQGAYIETYKNNLSPFKGFLECTNPSSCGNNPTVISVSDNSATIQVSEKMNFIFIDNASPILNAIAPDAESIVRNYSTMTLTSQATIR